TKEIHKAPSKSKVPEALLQSTEFCLLRRIELAASDDNVAREAQQRVRPLLDGPLGPLRHHVPLHRPVGDLHQLRDCRLRQRPHRLEGDARGARVQGRPPGVKKEEVKVEVEDGNVLVISGQRSREKEDKDDKWHRVERSSGQFVRRFRLPENAKVDQVKAGLENGVLTVTVPKAEEKKPEVKAIEISG
uniref:SHSP domain-containing protein n=1 Tax=Zea mays TaxID=4577 RepID=A0A804N0A1_MAIZE